jgi:hypothetical protein
MAQRPVYVWIHDGESSRVEACSVEFTWHAGYAVSQKQKSIIDLHEKAGLAGIESCLEVSTKSSQSLGGRLSAFNLRLVDGNQSYSVESAFQSSKVFRSGGPYRHLLDWPGRDVKRFLKELDAGPLIAFDFRGEEWPLVPPTVFYDWLYCRAMYAVPELLDQAMLYKGFTDIEFNPKKQINCQARSLAFACLMKSMEVPPTVLEVQTDFLKLHREHVRYKGEPSVGKYNVDKLL